MEVKDRMEILNQLKAERTNLDSDWQLVADYVYTQKATFVQTKEDNSFTNQDLFDKTACLSLMTRASTLLSLLWDGGKFSYKPNSKYFNDKSDENDWFQYASEVAQKEFKKAESDRIFFESEMDEGAFGLSYPFLDGEGENGEGLNLMLFQVKESYINETTNSKVDTLYRLYNITVKQAVDTFGIENVSEKTKSNYESNNFNEKVEMLHIIQPRMNRDVTLQGKDNMPFESVYIDTKNNKEMKKQGVQGGFEYFPVFISREGKRNGEKYAYSPSMMAIEEVAQLNKGREDEIIIINRMADPAIWYDSTALEGNILNTSPGSNTPFRMSGRAGVPVGDMVPTQGDAQAVETMIVRLQETINSYYGIDRLLDMNNDTQMTLGESQIRAQIRQQSLGATLTKKRIEKYEPIVARAFDILFKQGKFGYMPNDPRIAFEEDLGLEPRLIPEGIVELINGGIKPIDLIEIAFYTQFELEKQLLKNNTILQVFQNAGLIAQLKGSNNVMHNLDEDKAIKELGAVSMNTDIFRDEKEVVAIREAEAEQAEQQAQLANAEQLSKSIKNVS